MTKDHNILVKCREKSEGFDIFCGELCGGSLWGLPIFGYKGVIILK